MFFLGLLDEDDLRPGSGVGRAFRHLLSLDEEFLQLLEAPSALALGQDTTLGERLVSRELCLAVGLGLGVGLVLLALVFARAGLAEQGALVHRHEVPAAGLAGRAALGLQPQLVCLVPLFGLGLDPSFLGVLDRLRSGGLSPALLGELLVFLGALGLEGLARRHVLGVAARAVGREGVPRRRSELLQAVRLAARPHRGRRRLGLAAFGERPPVGVTFAAVAVGVALGGREPLPAGRELALGPRVHRRSRLLRDHGLGFDRLGGRCFDHLLGFGLVSLRLGHRRLGLDRGSGRDESRRSLEPAVRHGGDQQVEVGVARDGREEVVRGLVGLGFDQLALGGGLRHHQVQPERGALPLLELLVLVHVGLDGDELDSHRVVAVPVRLGSRNGGLLDREVEEASGDGGGGGLDLRKDLEHGNLETYGDGVDGFDEPSVGDNWAHQKDVPKCRFFKVTTIDTISTSFCQASALQILA